MPNARANLYSSTNVERPLNQRDLPSLPRHIRLGNWFRLRGRYVVHGWWAWELIAATVSVAATIALIVLLSEVDRRPQQTWAVGSTQITLNSVVVAIATLVRTSLLLVVAGAVNQSAWNWFASRTKGGVNEGRPLEDLETFSDATANSWNCLKLLWRTKFCHIVSIGALIMILSLAFDTFVQQVLTIRIEAKTIKLQGSKLTMQNILPYTVSYNDSGQDVAPTDRDGLKFQSLVTNGVLRTDNTVPGAVCPTGNCRWPVTPSIAVCSECTVTNATITTSSNSSCNLTTYSLPPLSALTGRGITNSSLTQSSCSVFSNTNWKLDIEYWPMDMDQLHRGRNTTIANLYSFGLPPEQQANGSESAFFAYSCSFYFCVQGYSASTALGKTTQYPISSITNTSHLVNDDGTDWWVFEESHPELSTAPSTAFRVSEETRQNIGRPFTDVLGGNWQAQYAETAASEGPSSNVAGILYEASDSLSNLTDLIQGISDTLTFYIRTEGPSPPLDERFAPIVGESIPVVVVRWLWLSFPLILLVGGLIFLCLTIYETHRRNVRPWKGRRVPLLLARLDDSVRAQAQGGLVSRTGLDDRVGNLHVRLDFKGDDDIAFRRVYSKPEPVDTEGKVKISWGRSFFNFRSDRKVQ